MTDQQHHQTKLPTETPGSHGRDEKGSGLTGHSPHGGHDKYEGHSVGMFRDRFSLPLVLTVPVGLLQ